MVTLRLILVLVTLISFGLVALNVPTGRVNCLGLGLLTLAILVLGLE